MNVVENLKQAYKDLNLQIKLKEEKVDVGSRRHQFLLSRVDDSFESAEEIAELLISRRLLTAEEYWQKLVDAAAQKLKHPNWEIE